MNVSTNRIRTKTFTCDDNYNVLDAADRSQSTGCKHHHTQLSASPTELHLNHTKSLHAFLPNTTMREAYTTCLRQSHLRDQRWTVYPHSHTQFSSISLSLFPPSPSASISSHFPNTAAFLLYYFDESLTVPPFPAIPHPFLHPLFSWQLSPHSPLSMPTLANTHTQRHVCAWPGIIIRFVMSSYYSLL